MRSTRKTHTLPAARAAGLLTAVVVAVTFVLAAPAHAGGAEKADEVGMSVCPPVVGDRETMLDAVSTLGGERRLGELCGVPMPKIKQGTEKTLAGLRPCLSEHGVKEQEIVDQMKQGVPDAEDTYKRSGVKDLLCQRVREGFE